MNYNSYEFRVENEEELEQLTTYFQSLDIPLAHQDLEEELQFPMTTAIDAAGVCHCCTEDGEWQFKSWEDDYNKAIPVDAILNPTKYPEYFI